MNANNLHTVRGPELSSYAVICSNFLLFKDYLLKDMSSKERISYKITDIKKVQIEFLLQP